MGNRHKTGETYQAAKRIFVRFAGGGERYKDLDPRLQSTINELAGRVAEALDNHIRKNGPVGQDADKRNQTGRNLDGAFAVPALAGAIVNEMVEAGCNEHEATKIVTECANMHAHLTWSEFTAAVRKAGGYHNLLKQRLKDNERRAQEQERIKQERIADEIAGQYSDGNTRSRRGDGGVIRNHRIHHNHAYTCPNCGGIFTSDGASPSTCPLCHQFMP